MWFGMWPQQPLGCFFLISTSPLLNLTNPPLLLPPLPHFLLLNIHTYYCYLFLPFLLVLSCLRAFSTLPNPLVRRRVYRTEWTLEIWNHLYSGIACSRCHPRVDTWRRICMSLYSVLQVPLCICLNQDSTLTAVSTCHVPNQDARTSHNDHH